MELNDPDGEATMPATQEQLLTVDTALANAARLLHNAELETNLPLMERLEHLADSWIAVARTLAERG
ncbi:hypothetical protein ACFZAR_36030 [Streptomyces sp. NPDC008222]|uniref:hypothetical protein n=1 Tax=Streptomyces sp. NPDC008222 TaxID=3364820 RepID=UPI0036F0A7B9